LLTALLLFSLQVILFAQNYNVNVQNVSLDKVLVQIRDSYNLQISFNNEQVSAYKVTLNKQFSSSDELIAGLLKNTPYAFVSIAGVYTIYYNPEVKPVIKSEFVLAGTIRDFMNSETLPFAHLIINNKGILADRNGAFKFISGTDSIFKVKISYLGYYILDTLVKPGLNRIFELIPSVVGIKEIMVKEKQVYYNLKPGDQAGTFSINSKASAFLPGNIDNAVYNLLRLQPGILASGESSKNFIIWGSYENQSMVLFDGFTIYSLKNFNDNISSINPYVVKDIKVLKGAFGPEYGYRSGGIIDITGFSGDFKKMHVKTNVDNLGANINTNIPLGKHNSLMLSVRKTFLNLFSDTLLTFTIPNRNDTASNSVTIYPDYSFFDFNAKFAGIYGKNNTYALSFLSGSDLFAYNYTNTRNKVLVHLKSEESNRQQGVSFVINHTWRNGNSSRFTQTYSKFNNYNISYKLSQSKLILF